MNSPFYQLCFPEYKFELKKDGSNILIFDELRTKWIACTPEEWVRQNLIKYLIYELNFPKNLIAIEKSLIIANRKFRFDILIYDKNYHPLLLVECKAPTIDLTQKTFDQIWNYNYQIEAPFFIVTNGIGFIMGKCSKKSGVEFFRETVKYDEILNNI